MSIVTNAAFISNLVASSQKNNIIILKDGNSRSEYFQIPLKFLLVSSAKNEFSEAMKRLVSVINNDPHEIINLKTNEKAQLLEKISEIGQKVLNNKNNDELSKNLTIIKNFFNLYKNPIDYTLTMDMNEYFRRANNLDIDDEDFFLNNNISKNKTISTKSGLLNNNNNPDSTNNENISKIDNSSDKKIPDLFASKNRQNSILKQFKSDQDLDTTTKSFMDIFSELFNDIKQNKFQIAKDHLQTNLNYIDDQDEEDIINISRDINNFLSDEVFPYIARDSRENEYNKLSTFSPLFKFFNKHIDSLDEELQTEIKIKLANLPCDKERMSYPQVYLTKKEQLHIIIKYLHDKQTELKEINEKDLFQTKELKRTEKTLEFFEEQKNLDEIDINIPRWCHATKKDTNAFAIANSKKIEVRHELKKGAWVSSMWEKYNYGNWAFSFTDRIQTIDSNPAIGTPDAIGIRRWRGLQKPIPLNEETLSCIGVPIIYEDKTEKIKDKTETKILKSKFKDKIIDNNIRIFSNEQVDFMLHAVINSIGSPNLEHSWYCKELSNVS